MVPGFSEGSSKRRWSRPHDSASTPPSCATARSGCCWNRGQRTLHVGPTSSGRAEARHDSRDAAGNGCARRRGMPAAAGPTPSKRERLTDLERENLALRRANEILTMTSRPRRRRSNFDLAQRFGPPNSRSGSNSTEPPLFSPQSRSSPGSARSRGKHRWLKSSSSIRSLDHRELNRTGNPTNRSNTVERRP